MWNITYDEIFRIEIPYGDHLIGYADDVASIIVARKVEEDKRKVNQVIIRTKSWLEDKGLKLALSVCQKQTDNPKWLILSIYIADMCIFTIFETSDM